MKTQLKILLAGDFYMQEKMLQKGPCNFFSRIEDLFKKADLRIVNFEAPVLVK